jgi:uncharacterized protein (TIGR03435 family)
MSFAKGSLRRSVKGSLKSAMRAVVAGALCAVTVGQMKGQNYTAVSQAEDGVAKALAYEVVTIKPPKGDPNSGGISDLPDGFSMTNLTLQVLIPGAYGVIRNDQVTNWPGWATFARFDIEAKMDVETADALQKLPRQQREVQRQLMMQSLLADRFKLKVHRGTEVRPTYELVLAKGGSRLKEDDPDDADGIKATKGVPRAVDWRTSSEGTITGHAMPISKLVGQLEGFVDSIIVDKTGLARRYDVALKWDPNGEPGPNSMEPSVFTALKEQLGLQLKPTKTAVETIVIDHLEMPSEN